MLEKSEGPLSRGDLPGQILAAAIRAYLNGGGRDVAFPSRQILSLEQATKEYRNKMDSPELLTQFMSAFWQEAGQRIGKDIVVDNFPSTVKEINERGKQDQMAIFVPPEVSLIDLGKMFPKMVDRAVQEGNSVFNISNNSGWLWVEALVDAPNLNTTQGELEKKFIKEGRQGQSLKSYIIGSQVGKLLIGSYFDQGPTWSRLPDSCYDGDVLFAYFDSNGRLWVESGLAFLDHRREVGGRSEEVIKV